MVPESAPSAIPSATPRDLRLPRESHLRSPKDYARAYREGVRARGDLLVVVLCPNGRGITRMGLSIGKRIWKHAVRRNRVRRVFREAFRLARHELPVGYDLVLIAAEPRLEPRLEATRTELVSLVQRAERKLRRREQRGQEPPGGRGDPRRPTVRQDPPSGAAG